MKRARGFSLVEVLVALMVVGLALPALLGQMQTQLDAQGQLKVKTIALYIAQNKINEYALQKQLGAGKFGDAENGEVEMAGQIWFWQMLSQEQDVYTYKIQTVQIEVGLKPGETLAVLRKEFAL